MEQRDREHAALVARLSADADYDSYEEFYKDEEREGDDTYIGEVVDGELQWEIRCLPNGEIAAFATAWTDEQAHLVYRGVPIGGPGSMNGAGGGRALLPAFVPVLIVVLGRAASADDAHACIARAANLDAIRTALG